MSDRGIPGLIIAAPASGHGKTLITLSLLRAARRLGRQLVSAKVGPDYIDPRFHEAAGGRICVNLDPWAMSPATLARRLRQACAPADAARECAAAEGIVEGIIVEGVMGLFDGARDGRGSTADLAALFDWPVLLVVDARSQAQSVAAVLAGFCHWRPQIRIAGVIFNQVGSGIHAAILRQAAAAAGVAVLGLLPRQPDLTLPTRHLGLVPAGEHPELEHFLERAADHWLAACDLAAVLALLPREPATRPPAIPAGGKPLPPLGQRIAIARDAAFCFAYPHLLQDWQARGASLEFFSPLADEAPPLDADAVFLPGGYPELHAGSLAAAATWRQGLQRAVAAGAFVYGECGGFMALGQGLEDATGQRHAMAGLLPVSTSFAHRRLHLGYRRITCCADSPLGKTGTVWRGHEFHYARLLTAATAATAPFAAEDAVGLSLGPMGCRQGLVWGSFLHLLDQESAPDPDGSSSCSPALRIVLKTGA